jgi:hypothetical protein
MKQPIQPVITDAHGVLRFQKNAIVDFLSKGRLNELATMDFSRDDWEQFHMLIGYSLSGCPNLSEETYAAADAMARKKLTEAEGRAKYNATLLASLREALRTPISELYGIHPDNLREDE